MFNSFIAGTDTADYPNYGTIPTVSQKINNVTIGPISLNDTEKGLNYKYWAAYCEESSGNCDIYNDDLEGGVTFITSEPLGVSQIALAFDQNGNDTYAWITNTEILKVRRFDSSTGVDIIETIGAAQSVTMTMDMKYYASSSKSDVLLFYIRSGAVYYRIQRDNYSVEYTTPLTSGVSKLLDSGITTSYRFQLRYLLG